MKVLVTGSAGLLGPFVLDELAGDYEVRGSDLQQKGGEGGGYEFVEADLVDADSVHRAVDGVDVIVHLGGLKGNARDHGELIMSINVMGTYNLLSAAREAGVGKFVYASSEWAMGYPYHLDIGRMKRFEMEYLPIDEEHRCYPHEEYGLSKLLCERMCRSYTESCGMQTICLRLTMVIAPGMYHKVEKRFREVDVWNSLWAYQDARDAAQACRLAIENETIEHDVFFITADDIATATPVEKIIVDRFGYVKRVAEGLVGSRNLISCEKAKRVLGYRPRYSWRSEWDGAKELLDEVLGDVE